MKNIFCHFLVGLTLYFHELVGKMAVEVAIISRSPMLWGGGGGGGGLKWFIIVTEGSV